MIIGISGKAGSGKDELAKMIREIQPEHDWAVRKFAGKLKEIASIIAGVEPWKFEEQEFKDSYMGEDWGMTYREFLQKLGTEGFRNSVHSNIWVNALFADYRKERTWVQGPPKIDDDLILSVMHEKFDYPNWIVTDVRFPNEAEAIRKRGYPLVKINRSVQTGGHSSENALEYYGRFNFEIDNNGSMNDLFDHAKRILSVIG